MSVVSASGEMAQEEAMYQPKDAVTLAIRSTIIMGGAGLTVSAIQNTLTKQNVSAMGVFTRTGSTIAVFGTIPSIRRSFTRLRSNQKYSCNGRNLRIHATSSRESAREER